MEDKMGSFEFYREAPVTTTGNMPKVKAVDLGAPKNLHKMNDTFMTKTNIDVGGRGQVIEVGNGGGPKSPLT
jgi:hypothetical protein